MTLFRRTARSLGALDLAPVDPAETNMNVLKFPNKTDEVNTETYLFPNEPAETHMKVSKFPNKTNEVNTETYLFPNEPAKIG